MVVEKLMGEVPDLFIGGEDLDRSVVFERLNTLNMMHHLLSSNRKRFDGRFGKERCIDLEGAMAAGIGIAEKFHGFLVENTMAMDEVKSNLKALVFGRFSDAVSMYEEYITKEDPIRDILIQMIPFFLSAVSERSYVSSAQIGHKGILRTHALHLYSEVYEMIKETRTVAEREEAAEVSGMIRKLYDVMDSLVEEEKGIFIFAALYLLLYNLRAGEVLNILNHEPENKTAEV